jgi:two-component system NtrC family response regulator
MDTILIVDDEKNYLVVLEALLGPEGYETITAENAKNAIRFILTLYFSSFGITA